MATWLERSFLLRLVREYNIVSLYIQSFWHFVDLDCEIISDDNSTFQTNQFSCGLSLSGRQLYMTTFPQNDIFLEIFATFARL